MHLAVDYLQRHDFSLFPRFLPIESGETIVRHDGVLYDLSTWAAGSVVSVDRLDAERLGNLGEAIARLHLAGEGASGPAPRLDWLSGRQVSIQRLAWDPVPRGRDSWQEVGNLRAFYAPLTAEDAPTRGEPVARAVVEVAGAALDWLDGAGPTADLASEPASLTHGDLWSDHVLFAGSEASALLDLDTLALRPAPGDLAALFADFGQWDRTRCRAILSGYRRHRAVSRDVVQALPRLAVLRTLGVLRERLRAWLEPAPGTEKVASLGGPVPYWCDQLRTLLALEVASLDDR